MDDVETRLAKLESKMDRIGESGLTSHSYWKRITTLIGYYFVIGIFWATIYFFGAVLIGLIAYASQ